MKGPSVADTVSQTNYDGLSVRYDAALHPMFNAIVGEALSRIASRPVGRRLLDEIHSAPMPTRSLFKVQINCPKVIEATPGEPADFYPGSKTFRGVETAAISEFGHPPGAGTGSAIRWNPNVITTPDGARPSFIGLAHELIHARRNLLGIGTDQLNPQEEEEYTVGFSLQGDGVNENAIRSEHGIRLRATYSGRDFVARHPMSDFAHLASAIT